MGNPLTAVLPSEHDYVDSPRVITAHDRCDRCGAQAYVIVEFIVEAQELEFCKHHFEQYETALATRGIAVHDFRHTINEKAGASA